MERKAAVQIDQLVQEIADEVAATHALCLKSVADSALQLWAAHEAAVLNPLISIVAGLWREHPDLRPRGVALQKWEGLLLSREAAEHCRDSQARLRDLVTKVEALLSEGTAPGQRSQTVEKSKHELRRMEEYLENLVLREDLHP